jgi:protein kinase N
VRFFAACILLGLEPIHKKNIVHRDLKPSNLVLDKTGYVRLIDLGISVENDKSRRTIGTRNYASPEVVYKRVN